MKFTLLLVSLVVFSTIAVGAYFAKTKKKATKSTLVKAIGFNLAMLFTFALTGTLFDVSFAQEATTAATETVKSSNGMGLIGAALSTGLAAIGTGIGVGQAGSAAIGAISENENILGKTIIIVGLAEGIAIYGMIISIMILQKI